LFVLTVGVASAQHADHKSGRAHQGHGASATDTREFVKFPLEHIEHTLANMRDHLAAIQEISAAMAEGKLDAAASVAENRLGMSSLRSHGAHEVSKFMPKGMQDAGTAMHRSASRFALEAQNAGVTGDIKPALKALGETLSACVGCHAGYRLK
jgi:hypothetical protein